MSNYKIHEFPDSRIASIDVCEIGKHKHHIAGLLEFIDHDVMDGAQMARFMNELKTNIEEGLNL
ncbi:MAG TPA: hypothetical protein DCS83_03845 [Prevotella sp.]|nr:hypothetical protein [Prevotella sp.]